MSEPLVLTQRRGAGLWLTINRPRMHNAMNRATVRALREALREASADRAVRAVVIVGAGEKAFTAGADIGEIQPFGPQEMAEYNRDWLDLFRAIEQSPKPVIAAVHGWAMGGGTEMSLACDFVICTPEARFGLAEINIGVIPGAGAAVRLTRWVGRLKAKEILMLGPLIPGEEAVALHLANRCVPKSELVEATSALVDSNCGSFSCCLPVRTRRKACARSSKNARRFTRADEVAMKLRVKIPKLGLTIEEVTLAEWLCGVGDTVAADQVIATIEADKANYELTAPAAGTLAQVMAEPGQIVAVGTDVAVIETA
jgi:enoyl-CoA hydratase/carnithine racemase